MCGARTFPLPFFFLSSPLWIYPSPSLYLLLHLTRPRPPPATVRMSENFPLPWIVGRIPLMGRSCIWCGSSPELLIFMTCCCATVSITFIVEESKNNNFLRVACSSNKQNSIVIDMYSNLRFYLFVKNLVPWLFYLIILNNLKGHFLFLPSIFFFLVKKTL